MVHTLAEYFRCPQHLAVLGAAEGLSAQPGYFRFAGAVGYGRHLTAEPGPRIDRLAVPFDLGEVVGNLRHERYPEARQAVAQVSARSVSRSVYYGVRPLLPVRVRKHLQRLHWRGWQQIAFPRWPVDVSVDTFMRSCMGLVLEGQASQAVPFIWFWPDAAPGCVMMTHDVEGPAGAKFSSGLMDLDTEFRITSAFQVVPDAPWATRAATRQFVSQLRDRGFEVNVHDLSHDGRLFLHRERFLRHAALINARGREYGSRGFRSGAMYRRQDWLASLDIAYDMSVPNVAHLEPQRGGCCTVMPYFNGHVLELPLTTAQDYTLFHVLDQYSTALWEEQIDCILAENGLISFITHPDYLIEPRAFAVYRNLLRILDTLRTEKGVWIARPADIDGWWRDRREMTLVPDGATWRVKGPGSDRASVAWARLEAGRVVYQVEPVRRAA